MAVELFNERGTSSVTISEIATASRVSKGNLGYHFKTKEEIVLAVVSEIAREISGSWYKNDDDLSAPHLAEAFLRHLALNYRYRFFYRELASLLRSSDLIQRRFIETRQRRMAAFDTYVQRSIDAGVFKKLDSEQELHDHVTSTWVFADNWINYLEAAGENIDTAAIRAGYRILRLLMKPILTGSAYAVLPQPDQIQASFLFAP